MITDIHQLEPCDRITLCYMVAADQVAGEYARTFLCEFTADHGTPAQAFEALFSWLVLAREGMGLEGAGHG